MKIHQIKKYLEIIYIYVIKLNKKFEDIDFNNNFLKFILS